MLTPQLLPIECVGRYSLGTTQPRFDVSNLLNHPDLKNPIPSLQKPNSNIPLAGTTEQTLTRSPQLAASLPPPPRSNTTLQNPHLAAPTRTKPTSEFWTQPHALRQLQGRHAALPLPPRLLPRAPKPHHSFPRRGVRSPGDVWRLDGEGLAADGRSGHLRREQERAHGAREGCRAADVCRVDLGGQLDGRDAHRVHEVGVTQQVADERLGWPASEVVVAALDVDAGRGCVKKVMRCRYSPVSGVFGILWAKRLPDSPLRATRIQMAGVRRKVAWVKCA